MPQGREGCSHLKAQAVSRVVPLSSKPKLHLLPVRDFSGHETGLDMRLQGKPDQGYDLGLTGNTVPEKGGP